MTAQKPLRGQIANAYGRMAEEAVTRHYQQTGHQLLASRWRGQAGEIDLIFQKGDGFVFVEVKAARDHSAAAARLSRAQMNRICLAATEFVATQPKGQLSDMRFDAALVGGMGRVQVIEAAFGTS